jgi:hypothetical protein
VKVIPRVQIIRLIMDQQFPVLPRTRPYSTAANS